jgi:hypothetical protein
MNIIAKWHIFQTTKLKRGHSHIIKQNLVAVPTSRRPVFTFEVPEGISIQLAVRTLHVGIFFVKLLKPEEPYHRGKTWTSYYLILYMFLASAKNIAIFMRNQARHLMNKKQKENPTTRNNLFKQIP